MTASKLVRLLLAPFMSLALMLGGCDGGGGSNDNSLTGTAATGAPLSGATVTVVGANGQTATATADANGAFTVAVTPLTFPAMVRAESGSTTLFSWANAANTTVNITPLTTSALVLTNLPDDLSAAFNAWQTHAGSLTQAALRAQQAIVNANLAAQLTAAGLTPQTYDFFSTAFTPNGSGIDGVMDALDFLFNFGGSGGFSGVVTINVAGTSTAVPFSVSIDTTGFNVGGVSGGGSGGGSNNLSALAGTHTLQCQAGSTGCAAGTSATLTISAAGLPTLNGITGSGTPVVANVQFGGQSVTSYTFISGANSVTVYVLNNAIVGGATSQGSTIATFGLPSNTGGGGGSGSATINFTASTPASGNGAMAVSGVSTSSDTLNGTPVTRVQVDGTVGGLPARVLVYFVTANGNVTNISYFWGSTLNDNIVFSAQSIPVGEAVVDLGTQTINIDTDLTDADGFVVVTPTKLSHISATINYP